jgi:two-component system, NarL family, sensor kinase
LAKREPPVQSTLTVEMRTGTGSQVVAWLPLGVAAVLVLASEILAWGIVGVHTQRDFVSYLVGPMFLILPAVGGLILSRRTAGLLGGVFCAAGLAFAIFALANAYGEGWLAGRPWPGGLFAMWLSSWIWVLSEPLFGTLGVLLFPDGRLPSRRWRSVFVLAVVMLAGLSLRLMFAPGGLDHAPGIANPYAAGGALGDAIAFLDLTFLLLPVTTVLAAWALIARTLRASAAERVQLQGPAVGGGLIAISFVICTIAAMAGNNDAAAIGPEIGAVAAVGVALLVSIARYRLWDIPRIVNRAVVYALLTASVLAVYALAVGALGLIVSGRLPSIIATTLAALAALPLHSQLQAAVNRLMYGDRDDPYRALTRLSERLAASLESEDVLPQIARTVAEALRLPYVEVQLESGSATLTASAGRAGRGDTIELALISQGEDVGRLLIETRERGQALSASDRRLLDNLVRQVAVAARGVALASDLRRSHERVVVTVQEERRRMHRDLHDGLGPTLAAIALGLDRARRQSGLDGTELKKTLVEIRSQTLEAIDSVRQLSYNLRPAALDQFGLVGALREQTERLNSIEPGSTRFQFESPDSVESLSAAVEVAVYRIASEAITNVVRHANAEQCRIRLTVNGALELEVRDDGRGLPKLYRAGVGLASMRDRAAEVGGKLEVARGVPHGTLVLASFPLTRA